MIRAWQAAAEIGFALVRTPETHVRDWGEMPLPWMAPFLTALSMMGNPSEAMQEVGLKSRSNLYHARRTHPEFKAAWEEAKESWADRLEHSAFTRASVGWDEPVFGPIYVDGKRSTHGVVGYVRKYSDRMLELLLTGARPDKYAKRVVSEGWIEAELRRLKDELEREYPGAELTDGGSEGSPGGVAGGVSSGEGRAGETTSEDQPAS